MSNVVETLHFSVFPLFILSLGSSDYSSLFTEGRADFLDLLRAFPSLLPPLHRIIGSVHTRLPFLFMILACVDLDFRQLAC